MPSVTSAGCCVENEARSRGGRGDQQPANGAKPALVTAGPNNVPHVTKQGSESMICALYGKLYELFIVAIYGELLDN